MPRCPSCHRRLAAFAPCPADGALAPLRAAPVDLGAETPPSLAGFLMGQPLAAGAFSVVWDATRLEDDAPAVLKISRAHSLLARERFRCETWALEQLGPPVSPRLLQNGVLEDGRAYIAMERLQGETLAARLEGLPAALDLRSALEVALAVLSCLQVVHERGLVHMDLAPENIFLEPGGGVRLLDFGLTQRDRGVVCHPADSALTTLGAVLGTPEYASPERLRAEPIDGRADLYALGALLFELLTLRPPFVGDRANVAQGHLGRRPPRPSDLATVPPSIEALVLACLAKERALRPHDAAGLRAALASAGAAVLAPAGAAAGAAEAAGESAASSSDRHDTVVLALEARGAEAEVRAAVARHEGHLARQRGYRFVAIFPGPKEAAAERALLAGREIVASVGAPLAIHVAPLKLRRDAREVDSVQAVTGLAVERPEAWLPADPWRGIALSAELVTAHPGFDVAAASEDGRYFFAQEAPLSPGERDAARAAPPPLVGRGDTQSAVEGSRERALAGLGPGLCALIGERGVGKSRLADEIAESSRLAHPGALVISVRADPELPGRTGGRPGQTAAALLAGVLCAEDGARAAPRDPRALCIERLGEPLGGDVWPAVAASLGWLDGSSDRPPPARRGSVIRAIAEGLRRRATVRPVVVIVDDAHLADSAALDALDLATRREAQLPLWVLLTGAPELAARRHALSARDHARDQVALVPLDDAAGRLLCAELLRPAEHPPSAALWRICAWAGYNPRGLMELTRAIKRAGLVRLRARSNSYQLATAELEKLPPSPAWQWFAALQLEALPPELGACAQLCAVLGFELSEDVAAGVQRALEREDAAAPRVDVPSGLRALVARGILAPRGVHDAARGEGTPCGGARYAFRSALLQEAIHALLTEEQRAGMHRHALAVWERLAEAQPRAPDLLEPVARHAAAAGAHTRAAHAYLVLGDLHRDRHNNAVAEGHYSSALLWADGDDQRQRYVALLGRARVRYRVLRTREALDDLRSAGALARTMKDPRMIAEALLEEATALDWAGAWEESSARVEEVIPLLDVREGHVDPALAARFEVAAGRSSFRKGNLDDALERLTDGAERVSAADHDTHVTGLTLLACVLMRCGHLDEAEQRFDEAVRRCEERGDRVHLCAALVRRAELWPALNAPERGMADLRRAVQLAREEANAWAEREATIKLAELLYLWGREDDALPLMRQVRSLDEQFKDRPVYSSALLLARIHAMRDEHADASRQLRWLRAQGAVADLPPYAQALLGVMQLAVRDPRYSMEGARTRATLREDGDLPGELGSGLSADQRIELLYWRARALLDAGRPEDVTLLLTRIAPLLAESRAWRPRFAKLRAGYGQLAG